MRDVVADSDAAVCIMHMRGEPRTMQQNPRYTDVVAEVRRFLAEQAQALQAAGVAAERLCVDPGFGFGKSLAHNLTLLRRLSEIADDGLPVLVGVSRKGMIGALTGEPVSRRGVGSVTAAVLAAERGADILRVHDVAETAAALKVLEAVAQ
jgi:dihydropteroate synthase